ncbi:inactive protein RESTRICTED TEV MOVEMENT 2-like [Corylus avellana]|uniref:inactive protein RESTRICTED TEV MOVEMENT 2-like n=1 Tax=Corylus avellana TaxID=13451 RepID=UPI002869F641|nr:inactive protein RESTRICTED TEV MOVEMENT 2-like [Corylus avellana]
MEINDGYATQKRTNIEIEPYCRWYRGKKEDRLDVHLHGFKREQLKIYINCFGTSMTVSGKRPLPENMWNCFSKKINISNDYAVDEIRSRFINGILSLSMPKKVPLLKKLQQQKVPLLKMLQQLGKKGSLGIDLEAALKTIIAVTVGMALGSYLAYKYSKFPHAEN